MDDVYQYNSNITSNFLPTKPELVVKPPNEIEELGSKENGDQMDQQTFDKIQFYCNIMSRSEFCVKHKIGSFKSHEEFQSPQKLKKFFSNYPKLFHVINDKVILKNWIVFQLNQQEWLKELVPESKKSTRNFNITLSIIQFICNMIFTKGHEYCFNIIFKTKKHVAINRMVGSAEGYLKFLSRYPEIFILKGNKVMLTSSAASYKSMTSWIKRLVNDSLYTDGIIEPLGAGCNTLLEGRSLNIWKNDVVTNETIGFYYKFLWSIPSLNGLFFCALFTRCNRKCPSNTVIKKFETDEEMKAFLSSFPAVFTLKNGIVFLKNFESTKVIASEPDIHRLNFPQVKQGDLDLDPKKHEKSAIEFYTNILQKISKDNDNIELPVKHLFYYRLEAPQEVKGVANTALELKAFLSKYPKIFKINNNNIAVNKAESERSLIDAEPDFKNGDSTFERTTRDEMIDYKHFASPNVQEIAKNPTELKALLHKFPHVFSVVNDSVTLSEHGVFDEDEGSWMKNDCIDFNNPENDVSYFSRILQTHGTCQVLSIQELFKFKNCSSFVQTISDIKQFTIFLMQYPDYFLVTGNYVIGKNIIQKCSNYGKYKINKFTDPSLVLIFNFFRNYTINKSLFNINNLYNVGRYFLYYDRSPFFKTKNDLLSFLALYPNVFYIDCERVINLVASVNKGRICAKRNKRGHKARHKVQKNPSIGKPKNSFLNLQTNKSLKCSQSYDYPAEQQLVAKSNVLCSNTLQNISSIEKNNTILKPNMSKANVEGENTSNIPNSQLETEINYVQTIEMKTNECLDEYCTNGTEQLIQDFSNISYGDVLEHVSSIEKKRWNEKFQNGPSRRFKRPSIREIENNVLAQFAVKLEDTGHKKQPMSCTDFLSSEHANFNYFPRKKKKLEKLTDEALIFLNAKLWEDGELQILKISVLYKLFSSESLQLTKYCRSIENFNEFLCKFHGDFIVSKNNVMARKNKSRDIVEECLPIMLSNFFDMYTQNNDSITVKQLYERVGQHFYNINQSKIFKFSEQLMLFLEMFPNLFYIDNNLNVINLTSTRKNENVSLEVTKCDDSVEYSVECKQINTFIESEPCLQWKDLVLKRTQIVEDKNECRRITKAVLKSEKIIAVDCEGVNLGAAGMLSLIQMGLESGQVYIFDIVKDKTMVIDGGLREIFESESIIKVIHDSRNDAANLYTEYGVEINKIFDTRVAHHLIVNSGVTNNNPLHKLIAIGFNELCALYGAPINIEKDEMKHIYKFNYMIWNERPLSKDMLAYAALDVACLVPQLYDSMLKQLKGGSEDLIWELSFKHSKSALNY